MWPQIIIVFHRVLWYQQFLQNKGTWQLSRQEHACICSGYGIHISAAEPCLFRLTSQTWILYLCITSDQTSLVSQLNAWLGRVMFTLCIGYTLHVPWKWLWASFQIVPNFMVLYTHGITWSHWFAVYPTFSVLQWTVNSTLYCGGSVNYIL